MTAFVIVLEMTDNHALPLPLMASAFIANAISWIVCPEPVCRALARTFLGAEAKHIPQAPELPEQSSQNRNGIQP
jgi:H+/Cl- antiporter ClcA